MLSRVLRIEDVASRKDYKGSPVRGVGGLVACLRVMEVVLNSNSDFNSDSDFDSSCRRRESGGKASKQASNISTASLCYMQIAHFAFSLSSYPNIPTCI